VPLELHRDLILPPDSAVLWRYMDFAKFIDLVETQSLWFSRTDQFEDPLEGTYTDAELEYLHSPDANQTPPGMQVADIYLRGPKYMRATAYASCWRVGEGESMAMWDLYGKGSGIVAVKTTVDKLKLAIAESPLRIFLGTVKYIDWRVAPWDNNSLAMCFRKDLSYEHETEVRAIIWDEGIIARNMSDAIVAARSRSDYPNSGREPFILRKEDGEHGIRAPFPPARLVREVVIGPREGRWVAGLVESVLKRYGLKINMTISNRLMPR